MSFATPVEITSGSTYVVSYFAPNGYYSSDRSYFTTAKDVSPLHGLQDTAQGANGVFRYGATSGLPSGGFQATNYWVDAVFDTTGPPDSVPPTVTASLPVASQTDVDPASAIKAAFSEAVQPATVVWSVTDAGGQPVSGTPTYDAPVQIGDLHAQLGARAEHDVHGDAQRREGQIGQSDRGAVHLDLPHLVGGAGGGRVPVHHLRRCGAGDRSRSPTRPRSSWA